MRFVFLETPLFTRLLPQYLDDEAYRALQRALMAQPDQGRVMAGTGGFRKLRWRDERRGKGSRGGLRVIYYWNASAKFGSSRSTTKAKQTI